MIQRTGQYDPNDGTLQSLEHINQMLVVLHEGYYLSEIHETTDDLM